MVSFARSSKIIDSLSSRNNFLGLSLVGGKIQNGILTSIFCLPLSRVQAVSIIRVEVFELEGGTSELKKI